MLSDFLPALAMPVVSAVPTGVNGNCNGNSNGNTTTSHGKVHQWRHKSKAHCTTGTDKPRQNPDHARKKKCWKNKYFETHEGFIAEMNK